MCAVVPFMTTFPLPGACPVVCWMPPVIVAAGSSAEWKESPEDPVPEAANCPKSGAWISKMPANAPFCETVKFALAEP